MEKKIVEKGDLCQISLTGVRSIVLLGLLIQAPRSLEDIREAFLEYKIIDDSNSDDILRIDINTLRHMGCKISRADHRTNNKFVLLDHPFKINITKEEINTLKKAFNKIKETTEIDVLINYDNLFQKIAKFISDKDIKEEMLGISPLKSYSLKNLEKLVNSCKNKQIVTLTYKAPTFKEEREIVIAADKIVFKNDKLYLFGVDKDSKESIYLNIKRIIRLISQDDNNETITTKTTTVKFFLKDFGASGLEDCETIISGSINDGFIIQGNYHNEFLTTQRILSFGTNCTVIEPEDFKTKIVELLKNMRKVYND